MKKILITGATGLIGSAIFKELKTKGDELTILTRNPENAKIILPQADFYAKWDYSNIDSLCNIIEGKNVIINLAGANIASKRWTDKYKKEILESRLLTTQSLVKAINISSNKPECFICSSASGYYGNGGDNILNEMSEHGNDFLSDVCLQWEKASQELDISGVRRVNIRTGIVLSTKAGALKRMLLPFKLFVGGPLGNGTQWFPWIHIDDLTNIYVYAIENKLISGPVNAAAPGIVTMKEFAKKFGTVLNRPSFFSVPKIILRVVVGQVADSLLASQRMVPKKLSESGYKFKFENIEEALIDLIKKR